MTKLLKLKQNTPEWLAWRDRKITGTKSDMYPATGNVPKKAFFEYIAENVALPDESDESDRDRGNRLEPIVRELVAKELQLPLTDSFVIESEDHTALSPDALVTALEQPNVNDITQAVEIKCPTAWKFLQILYINRAYNNGDKLYARSGFLANYGIPAEYKLQVLNYFLQLSKLETLYFVAYNENMITKKLVILSIKRDDVADELEQHKERLQGMLKQASDFMSWLEF